MNLLRRVRGGVRRLVRVAAGPGGEVALHRAYHRILRRTGRFTPPEDAPTLAVLSLLASRARTILDVGANTGLYAHFFLGAASRDAVLHAFEPHPGARALFEANVGHDPRVYMHPFALGEAAAELVLAVPLDELGNPITALAHLGDPASGETSLPVHVRALDRLIESGEVNLVAPVFAKIDVEGHEAAVLAGARKLIEARARIYFESQVAHLSRSGIASPWQALLAAGYEIIARKGSGWRRCDAPIEERPNYLAVPSGILPAGDLSHAAVVAALAGWETVRS